MAEHSIHMKFFVRGPFVDQTSPNEEVWMCWFFESDLSTQVGPRRMFGSAAKIWALVDRCATALTPKARFKLEEEIELGRGSVDLVLTETQYRKLKGEAV